MSWSQPKPRRSAFGQPSGGGGGGGSGAGAFGGQGRPGGAAGTGGAFGAPSSASAPWHQSGGWGNAGGQPPQGQPSQGQPPQGQPPFGQRPHGQPSQAQPPFGQRPSGQSPFGQPPPGQPPFGQSSGPAWPPGGPPSGGPPPGQYPPGYPPQPPRRRGIGPFGKAFFIAAPIAIVIVVIMGFAIFGGGGSTASSPPPSTPAQPPSNTVTSASPTPSTSPSPSEETSTQSSATYSAPTMTASTTRPKRPGPYGNIAKLTDSKLYGVKLGAWKCPALSDPIAPAGKAFRSWADGLVDCMMERFGPATAKVSGTKLTRPKLVYFSGTVETPCGKLTDTVPVYCGSSQSKAIYMNPKVVSKYDDYVRLGSVQILFHEFAHHVQHHFGLTTAGYQADVEERLQVSRRVELQAECISWSQTTQLTQPKFGASDAEQMWRWVSEGQDAKHGKASSYKHWYKRIRGKGDLKLCNTWIAAKKYVR